ncbi:MAG: hypothetical protein F9K48_09030 [Candidatus Brocadia sp.]|nr:MAG: hypothetical protein F9K48_09030 [Candidatus Brocadia sp.]
MRELLIFSSCGLEAKWIEFNASLIQKYGNSFTRDTLMYMVQIFSDARMRTTDSLLQRILLEMAVIKVCRMESVGSLYDIAERIAAIEDRFGRVGCEPAKKNEEIISPQAPISRQVVFESTPEEYRTPLANNKDDDNGDGVHHKKSDWEKILLSIQSKKKSTWALLREGQLIGFKDGEITVEFPSKCSFHKEKLEQIEEKKLVEQCAKEVVQNNVRLKLVVSKNGNPEKSKTTVSPTRSSSDRQPVDLQHSEPAVQKTLDLFGGHVVKVNKGG